VRGTESLREQRNKGDLICCLGEILLSVPVEIFFQLKRSMTKKKKNRNEGMKKGGNKERRESYWLK